MINVIVLSENDYTKVKNLLEEITIDVDFQLMLIGDFHRTILRKKSAMNIFLLEKESIINELNPTHKNLLVAVEESRLRMIFELGFAFQSIQFVEPGNYVSKGGVLEKTK